MHAVMIASYTHLSSYLCIYESIHTYRHTVIEQVRTFFLVTYCLIVIKYFSELVFLEIIFLTFKKVDIQSKKKS